MTGYSFYIDAKSKSVDVTSAVVTLCAGLLLRINQSLGSSLGTINAVPYEKVTQPGRLPKYIILGENGYNKAGSGWDSFTGLGVRDGEKIYQYSKTKILQKCGENVD
jgi:hypothetical protein